MPKGDPAGYLPRVKQARKAGGKLMKLPAAQFPKSLNKLSKAPRRGFKQADTMLAAPYRSRKSRSK